MYVLGCWMEWNTKFRCIYYYTVNIWDWLWTDKEINCCIWATFTIILRMFLLILKFTFSKYGRIFNDLNYNDTNDINKCTYIYYTILNATKIPNKYKQTTKRKLWSIFYKISIYILRNLIIILAKGQRFTKFWFI